MGTLGAVHSACASLWFLLEIVFRMKAELFGTSVGNGDQILFVRSCLRQDKLELVALWYLSDSHVPSMLWGGGAGQAESAHDRGLTGDGSTQNSFCELPNARRFVTKYIIKVHLLHFSSCVSIHLLMLDIKINQL